MHGMSSNFFLKLDFSTCTFTQADENPIFLLVHLSEHFIDSISILTENEEGQKRTLEIVVSKVFHFEITVLASKHQHFFSFFFDNIYRRNFHTTHQDFGFFVDNTLWHVLVLQLHITSNQRRTVCICLKIKIA